MNETENRDGLNGELLDENAEHNNSVNESEYEKNKYGVAYSPDDKGGYSDRSYGNYVIPSKKQSKDPSKEIKRRELKRIKSTAISLILVMCIVSALLGGVAGAYFMTKYTFPLQSGSSVNDIGGNIQIGETTVDNNDNPSPDGVIGDISINESEDKENMKTEFTDVVAKTANSVVEINTESVNYSQWSGQYIVTGAGSGVIISVDNDDKTVYYIVTNHHVIDGASEITVCLNNGKSYESTLVATDSITDIALLSIKVEQGTELTVAETISSDVQLLDGQEIYVIGNPLGQLGGSVAKGIISKTARRISMQGIKMTLMQIDAAVNPGNSGGGLFDISGRLIGIVNAKYSDEGIEGLGFAIPMATVKHVISELSAHGYVSGRPGLSLGLADKSYSTGSILSSTTVVYPTVTQDSSVSGTYAGDNGEALTFTFKKDDIIFAINDVSVNSTAALMSHLTDYKVGDTVKVSVYRQVKKTSGGREYTTTEEYKVSVVLTEYVPIA